MTPDDKRHGTAAGFYAHKVAGTDPCDPCDHAVFLYRKQWRRTYDQGIRSTVPTGPVAEHIRKLEQAGMTTAAIQAASGVTSSVFFEIRRSKRERCRRINAVAIFAVEVGVPATLDPKRYVSIVGTRRRIQALLAIGWTHEEMRKRCGIRTAVKLHSDADTISLRAHQRIAAMYDDLAMTPGGNPRTQDRARALGYPSPLAWEEGTIDDPRARPVGLITRADQPAGFDEARVQRRIAGDRSVKLHKGESTEVVRRMIADGWTSTAIRLHTGLKPERYVKVRELREQVKAA